MILATFLDPNNNGFDMVDAAEFLGLLISARLVFWGTVTGARKALRKEIHDVVDEKLKKYTQPIQPGYRNGGESLADLAHTVKRMATHMGLPEHE